MLSFTKFAATFSLITIVVSAFESPCEGPHLHFVNDYAGCSRYFSCVNGTPHPVECPDNLWFNLNPLGCFPPGTHPCDACPSTGVTRIGVDGTCDEYTLCINGVGMEGTCAPGTLFSRVEERCVLAEVAECDYLECPLSGSHIVADRTSCSHYIVCVNGQNIARRECSANMLFDRELGSCARSENVVCPLANIFSSFSQDTRSFVGIPSAPIAIPTAPRPITTTPSLPVQDEVEQATTEAPTTTEKITTTTTVATETTSQPPVIVRAWPAAPVTCPTTGVFYFGHHFVCSVFQVCTNGVLTLRSCPHSTHWNTIIGQCEIPSRANCPHHGGVAG